MSAEVDERSTSVRGGSPPHTRYSGEFRIWALNLFIICASAAVYLVAVRGFEPLDSPFRLQFPALALAFYLGELFVVHVQFKRDAYSFTLVEFPLLLGLFFADPAQLVLAHIVGSGIALVLHRRQSFLKTVFNLGHYSLETGLAVTIFHGLLVPSEALHIQGWSVAFLATVTATGISILMIAVAISLSEGSLRLETIPQGALYGSVVTIANTSLALIAVEVIWQKRPVAWLLLVPTLLLFLAYRAYVGQREKHESLKLLYESSRSVQNSLTVEDSIAALIGQAREMFRAEVAQVTLFSEEEGSHAAIRTSVGSDSVPTVEEVELNPREGVWARVAAEGAALLIPRPILNDRLRLHFAARGIFKDAMVAPLFGDSGVIGTVLVGDRLGDVSTFDSEDLRLFETLANHASVTLENARLVDKLRESLAHLTEMNELKDDFVAAVSHELRTPLTSIQGYVKTLLRPDMDDFDPVQRRAFLEVIDRQGERLRHLIEDLLVVARLEAHQVKAVVGPVNIAQLAEGVVTDLREYLAQHPITVEISPDLPVLQSDEGKLNQILTNLVDNATKYSGDGAPIKVTARVEGKGINVSVTDGGPGIPAEAQEKIFDRFYQVDQTSTRQRGGTGLGLYICRRLAESVGGRLWLEGSSSNGSTFSLWVPFAPPVTAERSLPSVPGTG